MKTKLKENLFIEGFDSDFSIMVWKNCDRNPIHWQNIIYSGETSKISEELANDLESDIKSILSACSSKFCVIYYETFYNI
ncbi:hypothetical protein M0Q97_12740 [Candidatus Dojkabacteria bacterium]|jgi:hypothetical protein|nr:hypothetical protein [Candidatus Dojkabacteria bacterium]